MADTNFFGPAVPLGRQSSHLYLLLQQYLYGIQTLYAMIGSTLHPRQQPNKKYRKSLVCPLFRQLNHNDTTDVHMYHLGSPRYYHRLQGILAMDFLLFSLRPGPLRTGKLVYIIYILRSMYIIYIYC